MNHLHPLRLRAPSTPAPWAKPVGAAQAARGFTLIELMITVAIVALLATLAYPAYTSSIIKGKRAEGRAALNELLLQQERHLTQRGTYATFAAGAANTLFRTTSGDSATGAAYRLSAAQCTNPDFALNECVLLSAVPNFTDAEVGTLTIRSTGERSCTGNNTSKCWR